MLLLLLLGLLVSLGSQLLGLLAHFLDGTDHVEGYFWQMVELAVQYLLKSFNCFLQWNELAWSASENFGNLKGDAIIKAHISLS